MPVDRIYAVFALKNSQSRYHFLCRHISTANLHVLSLLIFYDLNCSLCTMLDIAGVYYDVVNYLHH